MSFGNIYQYCTYALFYGMMVSLAIAIFLEYATNFHGESRYKYIKKIVKLVALILGFFILKINFSIWMLVVFIL